MTDNADGLNRYLDELVSGEQSASLGIDLDLIATIRRLSALNRAPATPPLRPLLTAWRNTHDKRTPLRRPF